MRKIFVSVITVMLVLGLSISTHAALIDLGDGMIYSTDLDLIWLQDANYARTSGYSLDGFMTWDEANTWATNLVYGDLTGWRLPTFDPANPDALHNGATPLHEMGYLLYTELGNTGGGGYSYAPFINVITPDSENGDHSRYWSGTTDTLATSAWEFWFT